MRLFKETCQFIDNEMVHGSDCNCDEQYEDHKQYEKDWEADWEYHNE